MSTKAIQMTNVNSGNKLELSFQELDILLKAYTWVCRRDDIYQKLASRIDLDDKTLLGLNLKVNKFLRGES